MRAHKQHFEGQPRGERTRTTKSESWSSSRQIKAHRRTNRPGRMNGATEDFLLRATHQPLPKRTFAFGNDFAEPLLNKSHKQRDNGGTEQRTTNKNNTALPSLKPGN